MVIEALVRSALRRFLIHQDAITLEGKVPRLEGRFRDVEEIGLYLHIPFCRQICPYCPYHKELYSAETAARYASAVMREADRYAPLIEQRPVTTFYIGGGTPTVMLYSGMDRILSHLRHSFNLQCGIHMESHPSDLTAENLDRIQSLGVEYLSIGVEALQDHHLRTLHRPYTAEQVITAIRRAVERGFRCVNVDLIFALPGQTRQEIEQAGRSLVQMGVDQVAAYPLFEFPYTAWPSLSRRNGYHKVGLLEKRRMLAILERLFYDAGFERTSVWAFTRSGVAKYCSVTVPLYVGLGASGGSYLRDLLYFNTFSVAEYIRALEEGRSPIALSLELSEAMQRAGWLYWRIYETRFHKGPFRRRFGKELDLVYGATMRALGWLGLLTATPDEIILSDRGAFWLHALQDLFSIGYISKLWGLSRNEPWPERVEL